MPRLPRCSTSGWLGLAILLPALAATPAMAGHADTPQHLVARADVAQAAGRFDDAAMLMQAAMAADPARPATYVKLAGLYAAHGDARSARKYYDEALYLDPTSVPALEGAGQAAVALDMPDDAAQLLERLRHVCGETCPQAQHLAAAMAGMAAGPAMKSATADKPQDNASASLDKH